MIGSLSNSRLKVGLALSWEGSADRTSPVAQELVQMKVALFQHGNKVKGKDDCLVSCSNRLEEAINIKITTDGFSNFAAIVVLIIISSLSQSFIGSRRVGCGTKYVGLNLVLLRFITEISTPPQEP